MTIIDGNWEKQKEQYLKHGRMSGCVKCGNPTTALINHVMHASKKELRQMLISFITSEPTPIEYEPIEEVEAQRPDVDNAHVIAAEIARQLDKVEPRLTKRVFPYEYNKQTYDESYVAYHDGYKILWKRLAAIEDIIYGEGENK